MVNKNKNQAALGFALLIYMCIVVAVITLIPFDFHIPAQLEISWTTNFSDFVTNIFLFIPIGFLFRLARSKNKDPYCLQTLVLGVVLSMTIETAQVFIPVRYTQGIDVVTNGVGAWSGGMVYAQLTKWMRQDRAGKLFAAELPLVGLIYLLIPLMWLNGLSIGQEKARLMLLLLLGSAGAVVISAVYINLFKHTGTIGYTKLSVFTLGWFFLSSLPALIDFPSEIACFGMAVMFLVQIFARFGKAGNPGDKRFEIPTIKKLLPWYVIYLLLVSAWPTTVPISELPLGQTYQVLPFQSRLVLTFRFIELIAAFTLLGYLIAEIRGRKNESADKTLFWAVSIAFASAIFFEVLKTYPVISGINILSIIIIISASTYGAVIYRLQLSAIERMNV